MERSYITLTFKIVPEDDAYVATCQELGIVSQGDSLDDGLSNIKDAAVTLLNELEQFGEVDEFLKEHGITRHVGMPPVQEPEETVKVRAGEVVSVLQAVLGSQVAFSR